jgi:DNA-binding beta-propeller fold protein YncE
VFGFISGCGDGGTGPDSNPIPTLTTTVGAKGDTLESAGYVLAIPDSAVVAPTTFTMRSPKDDPEIPSHLAKASHPVEIVTEADLRRPLILTLPSNISSGDFLVRYEDGNCEFLGGIRNPDGGYSVALADFSVFQLMKGIFFGDKASCDVDFEDAYYSVDDFGPDLRDQRVCMWQAVSERMQEYFYKGDLTEQVFQATSEFIGAVVNSLLELDNITLSFGQGYEIASDLLKIKSAFELLTEPVPDEVMDRLSKNMNKLNWTLDPTGRMASALANENGSVTRLLAMIGEEEYSNIAGLLAVLDKEIELLEEIKNDCKDVLYDNWEITDVHEPTYYEQQLGISIAQLAEKEIGLLSTLKAILVGPGEVIEYVLEWGGRGSAPGQFRSPRSLAVDVHGNVYVEDVGNDRVQKFTGDGRFVSEVNVILSVDVGGMCVDPDGNILVGRFDEIVKYSEDGDVIGSISHRPLRQVWDVASNSDGNVYVSDRMNNMIHVFTPDGSLLTEWGGQWFHMFGMMGVDSDDCIYVTNFTDIWKFSSDGEYLKQWGDWYNGGDLGGGTRFMDWPWDIAVDSEGYMYVTDVRFNCVRKFSADGIQVAIWGSEGTGNGQFKAPLGIAVDNAGNIYVADNNNTRIQKFRQKVEPELLKGKP